MAMMAIHHTEAPHNDRKLAILENTIQLPWKAWMKRAPFGKVMQIPFNQWIKSSAKNLHVSEHFSGGVMDDSMASL